MSQTDIGVAHRSIEPRVSEGQALIFSDSWCLCVLVVNAVKPNSPQRHQDTKDHRHSCQRHKDFRLIRRGEGRMFELKPLSKEAIPAALQRAERYRLLNEAAEAESICLDILQSDPENQQALITLLLALTDQ